MKTKTPLLLLVALVCGCKPNYIDVQKSVVRRLIDLPPNYSYYDVVWLPQNMIALAYSPEYSVTQNDKISIYDVNSSKATDVALPPPSQSCPSKWVAGNLAMLPDGNLAFNTVCYSNISGGPQLLFKYDMKRSQTTQLFDFGNHMSATHFTFISQDEFLQENAVGHPMSNELYEISLTNKSTIRLVPNFLRARLPSWSPQIKKIAFWGTEKFPGKDPEGPYSFDDIARLVNYPWDLYIMDEDGNNIRKILPLVDNAGDLSWSPTSAFLAFGGTINGIEGIWLLDLNNSNLIRIFEKSINFDWSPEGTKLIVVESKWGEQSNDQTPTKAYILTLPQCIFDNTCK
jgi:Tol biopolymer transport system component